MNGQTEIRAVYERVTKAMPAGARVDIHDEQKFGIAWDLNSTGTPTLRKSRCIYVRFHGLFCSAREDIDEAIAEIRMEMERRGGYEQFKKRYAEKAAKVAANGMT